MNHQRQLDDLIKAAWMVVQSDFDRKAFFEWRKQALLCLTDLLGPDHVYTLSFEGYVKKAEALSVLSGKGLLVAAREHRESAESCPRMTDARQGLSSNETVGNGMREAYRE